MICTSAHDYKQLCQVYFQSNINSRIGTYKKL